MNAEYFDKIFTRRQEKSRLVLAGKAAEYAADGDRLHNFKVAGRKRGRAPEDALWGMAAKHDVSVQDIVDACADPGYAPSREMVDEKIGDLINYLHLLEGLLVERIERVAKVPVERIDGEEVILR